MSRRVFICFLALLSFCGVCGARSDAAADFLGTWEGESICTVRPSACHDEHVIYEITRDTAGKLSMSADKVVNGERQNMGTLTCTYARPTLRCEMPNGVWSFDAKDGKMTGTLTLTDGRLFRRVNGGRPAKH